MKKRIKEKMEKSQWRWDNIFKASTGLLVIIAAIFAVIAVSCSKTEAKAIEAKVTLYDVPVDIEILDHIQGLCGDYEIPIEMVLAVIERESSYKSDAVSAAGAIGLMQVIPESHEPRMKQLKCTDLFDPKQNITVGMDFLAELLEKYKGDKHKALTAYNHGEKGANDKFFSKGIYQSEYSRKVLETAEKIKEGMTKVLIKNFPIVTKLPECSDCDKVVKGNHFYLINDEVICPECLEANYKKDIADYIE